jgi:predicted nucleotidyltransferase component of viral defense system
MSAIDLTAWVDEELRPERKVFRQAVQLVLRAIAQSPSLSAIMIMKGGLLLAVRYHSSRFTRDIDFSTSKRLQEVDLPTLLATIAEALASISADNEHAMALRLQSHEIKPPNRPGVNFPTLQMRIGYASRLEPRSLKRLESTGSTQVVQIDYSFNEWASGTEQQEVDGGQLLMYPFHDLVAEKLRSVLQQPLRGQGRPRYQDIYDLFLLLETAVNVEDKAIILAKLFEASRDRQVPLHKGALRDEQVIQLSREEYATVLPGLVVGPLPDFDVAYKTVQDFFESLPWQD